MTGAHEHHTTAHQTTEDRTTEHRTTEHRTTEHRTLVVTAVDAERTAVLDGLRTFGIDGTPARPDRLDGHRVTVAAVGVGPYAATAGTARLLALAAAAGDPYQIVLSAGIGGGFADRVGVGGLVVATGSVAADLGVDDPGGFLPLDRLGFGPTTAAVDPRLEATIRTALPGAAIGAVLTVSTATGTAERAAALRARYPDAAAEAMEGFGVATAATAAGAAFAELRAVSNLVGPRDRASWQIPAALTALGTALAAVGRALDLGGATSPGPGGADTEQARRWRALRLDG